MKKIYLFSKACMFAAMMFVASSCSEEETVVTPIFPEGETVETVVPGTEYTLSFTANMDWELKSSALWCLFSNGFQSVKGEAGENISQTLTINNNNWTVDDAVAEITLIMGNEEKVIAKYTRTGQALSLLDANDVAYGENNSVKLEYKQVGQGKDVTFKTNYDWIIDELPEWIVVENAPLSGTNSELKTIKVTIDDVYLAYAKEDVIKVRNKNNDEQYCEIPVVYYGIDRISSDINAWAGYTFNADASGYTVGETTVNGNLEINNVLINGNDYRIFYLLKSNPYTYSEAKSTSWMNCSISKEGTTEACEATVSVNKNEDTSIRYGEILVVPSDTLIAIGGDDAILNENKELNAKLENYILVSISQNGQQVESEVPFTIESSPAASFVKKTDLTSEEQDRYSGDVYVCELQANTAYSSFVIKASDEYKPKGEEIMWMTAMDMGLEWAKPWIDKNNITVTGMWNDWFDGFAFSYYDSSWNSYDGMSETHGYDYDMDYNEGTITMKGTSIPYVIYITDSTGSIIVTLVIERKVN